MKSTIFALALMSCLPMLASDDVKTLPPAMYEQLKSGKKLDKVWVSPDYYKTVGVTMNKVEWKAEDLNGPLMEYFPKALDIIAKKDGGYILQLTVTKVSGKIFTGFGYVSPKVSIEGKIVNKEGTIVAAFLHKAAAEMSFGGENYNAAADKIVSAIKKDLL